MGQAAETQTLLGPFLSLPGLLKEWVGPNYKLLNSPEDELRVPREAIRVIMGVCQVRPIYI